MTRPFRVALLVMFILTLCAQAQRSRIDSLRNDLKSASSDTARIQLLFNMAAVTQNFEERYQYLAQCDSISQILVGSSNSAVHLQGQKLLATVYQRYSEFYRQQGNLGTSINYAKRMLNIYSSIGDKDLIAMAYIIGGNLSNENGEYAEAVKYLNAALTLAQELKSSQRLAQAYLGIGRVHMNLGKYADALKSLMTAAKVFNTAASEAHAALDTIQALTSRQNLIAAYSEIRNVYTKVQDYDKALEYNRMAAQIVEETNDDATRLSILFKMGDLYLSKHDLDSALMYLQMAEALSRKIHNIWALSTCYEREGYCYLERKEYQRALALQQAGLDLAIEIGDKRGIADSYDDISQVYEAMGRVSQHYYDSAYVHGIKALGIYESLKNESGLVNLNINIGRILFSMKSFSKAKKYFQNALRPLLKSRDKKNLQLVFEYLSRSDSALNNHASAYAYLLKANVYRDSLTKEDNDKEFQNVQFRHEVNKIEETIAHEQQQKDGATKREIEQQKNLRNAFIGGIGILSLFLLLVVRQRNRITSEKANVESEKRRSDELLLNILPSQTAEELKLNGRSEARSYEDASVMFTDFKDFTRLSEHLSPHDLVDEIHRCYSAFDEIIAKHGIEKIKTIGDSYMCAAGLPVASEDHALKIVQAGLEIRDFMLADQKSRQNAGKLTFEIRIGIHSGPVVAGIVGTRKFAYDIWGDTVNVASRMQSTGEVGKVHISVNTYNLVKDNFLCHYRGPIAIKNRGEIDSYFVESKPLT